MLVLTFSHVSKQPDELIDNLISEAMNMGEQPLRLKPPSTDTVLDELSRKGIYSSIHGPV